MVGFGYARDNSDTIMTFTLCYICTYFNFSIDFGSILLWFVLSSVSHFILIYGIKITNLTQYDRYYNL